MGGILLGDTFASMAPPPTSGPLDGLQTAVFEIAGFKVTGMMLVAVGVTLVLFIVKFVFSGGGGKSCSARHILMKSQEHLLEIAHRINNGEDFSQLAAQCSTC